MVVWVLSEQGVSLAGARSFSTAAKRTRSIENGEYAEEEKELQSPDCAARCNVLYSRSCSAAAHAAAARSPHLHAHVLNVTLFESPPEQSGYVPFRSFLIVLYMCLFYYYYFNIYAILLCIRICKNQPQVLYAIFLSRKKPFPIFFLFPHVSLFFSASPSTTIVKFRREYTVER